jgi:hypothetical protein
MPMKILARNYLYLFVSASLCVLPNASFASCSSSHEIDKDGAFRQKPALPQTSLVQLHKTIKDRMRHEEKKARTKVGKPRVKNLDSTSRNALENEKPLTPWSTKDLFRGDGKSSASSANPASDIINHLEPTERELQEMLDFERAVQLPNKTAQIEQASASFKGLSCSKGQSQKLIFERDREGNLLHSKAGLTASWKPFSESAIQQELDLLMPELSAHMTSRLKKTEHPTPYNAITKDAPKKSLIQVGTIIGGGDCGFFAYGQRASRSVFINRIITALLLPDTTPLLPGMGSREDLHSFVTYDLFQRALLNEEGQFLKTIGSKKTFEELFKEGPEKARIKPYILANFVYAVYAQELECLSVHMLKALAHMDGINLCIWTEDNSQRDKQEFASLKTLKLVDRVLSFPQAETEHLFFDGIGHFSTAIEDDNALGLLALQKKSLLSLALELLLSKKGIGAQEYQHYTEAMKTLYQGLCA